MKILPSGLQDHLASGTTTLCWCWRIARGDGLVQGFTDHDGTLAFDGVAYEAASGFTASEVQSTLGLAVDNLTVMGALSSATINEDDLAAGLYDDAAIEIWRVNWAAPDQRVLMRKGNLGQVSRAKTAFQAEVRGLAHRLNQSVGRAYGYSCDADLGDARCTISLAGPTFTATGTVAAVTDARRFTVTGLASYADGWFGGGRIAWTSGANAGRAMEVIRATCIDTTPSDTAMGGQLTFLCTAIGAASPSEIARLDAANGLSLFGANPVIDQNRAHRLRSTTIAGAVAPSVAGNLFYHSDAQGGAGEVSVDTASAYRHAGQAAIKHLTSNADATYTPRADGRIVRDTATLTANRKLTLAVTNVTDGHKVEVTRRGSSGGFTRGVYQADGTTLIVSLADNAGGDFVYDASAALWFQK